MRRKTTLILLIMVISISVYVVCTSVWDYEYVSTVVATIVATMGIFGVWVQLKKETSIKEAEFLMNYNFTFITTEKFVRIENRLERWRTHQEPLNLKDEERQDIIDYLVYLESFAPLVLNDMVRLDVIDNLFGYRYFIAVNNPEIQQFELFPEADYYRGCFELYPVWKKYRIENSLPIPLKESGLDRWKDFDKFSRKKK